jgi:hypothetical protein
MALGCSLMIIRNSYDLNDIDIIIEIAALILVLIVSKKTS